MTARPDLDAIRTAVDFLCAEVARNTCVCGCAFADHDLYAGTNYITCQVCENECEGLETWRPDDRP